jgi:hypothetical protein
MAAHPTPITCKAEALAVKFVGEKIGEALGDYLAFERGQLLADVRTVARLRHDAEGKWWSVRVCAGMAWRSWGKLANGAEQPGMDNWEHCHDGAAALAWAVEKATKQLKKGYAHGVGSDAQYAAACAEVPTAPPRGRRAGAAMAAAAPSAAPAPPAPARATSSGSKPPTLVAWDSDADAADTDSVAAPSAAPSTTMTAEEAEEAEEAAEAEAEDHLLDNDGAEKEGEVRKRVYHPKLTNPRGEVAAAPSILVALYRAGAIGTGSVHALSTAELLGRAQKLCPAIGLTATSLGGNGRARGGRTAAPGRALSRLFSRTS